jgi:hypothetical protein
MAFRTSPNLGPDLEQFDLNWWYDPDGTVSPLLGNPELGSDGHYYVLVKAGAAFATAGTDVTINETTWVATAGAGGFETPVAAIPIDAYFYARSIALPQ